MLMVAHHGFTTQTVSSATATTHVAPTILKALGLEPRKLDVVRLEGAARKLVLYESVAEPLYFDGTPKGRLGAAD